MRKKITWHAGNSTAKLHLLLMALNVLSSWDEPLISVGFFFFYFGHSPIAPVVWMCHSTVSPGSLCALLFPQRALASPAWISHINSRFPAVSPVTLWYTVDNNLQRQLCCLPPVTHVILPPVSHKANLILFDWLDWSLNIKYIWHTSVF